MKCCMKCGLSIGAIGIFHSEVVVHLVKVGAKGSPLCEFHPMVEQLANGRPLRFRCRGGGRSSRVVLSTDFPKTQKITLLEQ